MENRRKMLSIISNSDFYATGVEELLNTYQALYYKIHFPSLKYFVEGKDENHFVKIGQARRKTYALETNLHHFLRSQTSLDKITMKIIVDIFNEK